MKKVFTLLAVVFALSTTSMASATSDLFALNETELNADFNELNQVEAVVVETNADYNTLIAANFPTSNLSASSAMATNFSISDMDWKSFAWGFCCWPIGIFTVLLSDKKDSDSKISFFIGLGTSVVLSLISGAGAASAG